jgi:hypothetical protein
MVILKVNAIPPRLFTGEQGRMGQDAMKHIFLVQSTTKGFTAGMAFIRTASSFFLELFSV